MHLRGEKKENEIGAKFNKQPGIKLHGSTSTDPPVRSLTLLIYIHLILI